MISSRKRIQKPGFSVPSFVVHVCVLINNQEKARNSFLGRAFEVLKYRSFDAMHAVSLTNGDPVSVHQMKTNLV